MDGVVLMENLESFLAVVKAIGNYALKIGLYELNLVQSIRWFNTSCKNRLIRLGSTKREMVKHILNR